MRFLRTVIFTAALAAPAVALAQAGGHSHDAPNGGQIQKIGNMEGELVVKGSNVILYVVDAKEQKVDASKLTATAVVLAKGNKQKVVELKPGKENILAAMIDFPVEGKFRATVTLKSGSTEIGKGRFSLDAK